MSVVPSVGSWPSKHSCDVRKFWNGSRWSVSFFLQRFREWLAWLSLVMKEHTNKTKKSLTLLHVLPKSQCISCHTTLPYFYFSLCYLQLPFLCLLLSPPCYFLQGRARQRRVSLRYDGQARMDDGRTLWMISEKPQKWWQERSKIIVKTV